jgi:hypothetical protein
MLIGRCASGTALRCSTGAEFAIDAAVDPGEVALDGV